MRDTSMKKKKRKASIISQNKSTSLAIILQSIISRVVNTRRDSSKRNKYIRNIIEGAYVKIIAFLSKKLQFETVKATRDEIRNLTFIYISNVNLKNISSLFFAKIHTILLILI